MILGDGFLADGARAAFPAVPFYWVLDHPTLKDSLSPDWPAGSLVVISTPILCGTIAALEDEYPYTFAYVPENVREAHPEDWTTQSRFIIGTRSAAAYRTLATFFRPSMLTTPESAEMIKHAINGYLALTIGYGMDIADLAEHYGANPFQVAEGMMSDSRIGHGAYLKPKGRAIGPNLQREVDHLRRLQR